MSESSQVWQGGAPWLQKSRKIVFDKGTEGTCRVLGRARWERHGSLGKDFRFEELFRDVLEQGPVKSGGLLNVHGPFSWTLQFQEGPAASSSSGPWEPVGNASSQAHPRPADLHFTQRPS